ncbi:MAG: penicillin-binding protein activator [Pseudomonadota bacterium]
MSCKQVVLLFALSISLLGCGPATTPVKNTAPPPKPTASAEAALANRNYLAAAEEFWRLSSQSESPASAERFAMQAALAYIDAQNFDQAAAIVSATAVTDTTATRIATLVSATIGEVSPGYVYDPDDIINKLQTIEARSLTPYQKSVYHRTLGRAQYSLASFSDAATSLNRALDYQQPAHETEAIHQQLWQAIAQLTGEQRTELISTGNKNLTAWLALKDSTNNVLHDGPALDAAINAWRTQFPSHPANLFIVEQLYEISESISGKASNIALLLPFEGRYQRAATAIRDGFLSAWFDDADTLKPIVNVYSVNPENVASVYQTAVGNGADYVVGPLQKKSIENLLQNAKITVPILLLNRINAGTISAITANPDLAFKQERVYQFALSPEDEASSIARHIWDRGHRRVAAMGTQTKLGERLLTAFRDQWESLGGTILRTVDYGGDQSRYANAVRKTFALDYSTARAKQLIKTLGRNVIHSPRARKDVDGVFLAGLPVDNRQLIPQLRYFGVANVPMYSSSHTFTGIIDPGNDIDLDGANFGDMPLILGIDSDNADYDRYQANWLRSGPQSTRMFAFGLDAYQLAMSGAKLRYQDNVTYRGATGNLNVDRTGIVTRNLQMAKFVNGVPSVGLP